MGDLSHHVNVTKEHTSTRLRLDRVHHTVEKLLWKTNEQTVKKMRREEKVMTMTTRKQTE